jgi:hypothetical protein
LGDAGGSSTLPEQPSAQLAQSTTTQLAKIVRRTLRA